MISQTGAGDMYIPIVKYTCKTTALIRMVRSVKFSRGGEGLIRAVEDFSSCKVEKACKHLRRGSLFPKAASPSIGTGKDSSLFDCE